MGLARSPYFADARSIHARPTRLRHARREDAGTPRRRRLTRRADRGRHEVPFAPVAHDKAACDGSPGIERHTSRFHAPSRPNSDNPWRVGHGRDQHASRRAHDRSPRLRAEDALRSRRMARPSRRGSSLRCARASYADLSPLSAASSRCDRAACGIPCSTGLEQPSVPPSNPRSALPCRVIACQTAVRHTLATDRSSYSERRTRRQSTRRGM